MDNSLAIELFLMGWKNARDGVPLSLAWPDEMGDGWRLWHDQTKVVELARHRRRACNETNVHKSEKASCSVLQFFRD